MTTTENTTATTEEQQHQPVIKKNACLIVIDGWGISPEQDSKGDAIRNAKTPVMSGLEEKYQFLPVAAHGLHVGLPDGLMGNSEVGHLNIGAGRVVYQDIVRIELSIKNKTFAKEASLVKALEKAKNGNGRLHLLGLVSDGGVHSHINHLFEFLKAAKDTQIPETFVHFFGDGRDTAPRSSITYLKQLLDFMNDEINYGKLADITGRYYAMDRDKRWERIKIAYEGLVQGLGEETDDPVKCIEARYAADETDEFLKPIIVNKEGRIQDGDTLIFFNFRSDRMREINQALGITPLPFETTKVPKDISITSMTQYKGDFPFDVIFAPQTMENCLSEWLDKKSINQCHVAETEKYAHVTFFFNGGTETQFKKEHRDLIPSPKVATYDLKPEMSVIEVGQKVAEEVESGKFPFVMCNFAPPDMVGHTGKYEEAILGVEATDKAIGVIYEACKRAGYVLFITADHGNAEKMISENGEPHTAHTTAKVPFIMTNNDVEFVKDQQQVEGSSVNGDDDIKMVVPALCDVAPTILEVMGIPKPKEMTGRSLIKKD